MTFEPGTLRIGTSCPVKWSSMVGAGRVRFCGKCQQKVYDLSDLPPEEIRELVSLFEGRRLCARFYARKDDRVMVRDCPLGRKLQRRWQPLLATGGIVAMLALGLIAVISLLSDNLRRQYAMAGDLVVEPAPEPKPRANKWAGHGPTNPTW